MDQKWYDRVEIEPMIWFSFFMVQLIIALFVTTISDTASKLLFMGATLCASRVRSPVKPKV
jgi:hypothetical protein